MRGPPYLSIVGAPPSAVRFPFLHYAGVSLFLATIFLSPPLSGRCLLEPFGGFLQSFASLPRLLSSDPFLYPVGPLELPIPLSRWLFLVHASYSLSVLC